MSGLSVPRAPFQMTSQSKQDLFAIRELLELNLPRRDYNNLCEIQSGYKIRAS